MAEKWIQNAIKKPGALRAELGVKKGEKIPAKKLTPAKKAAAKAEAKRKGQTYPSLVANMRAARGK